MFIDHAEKNVCSSVRSGACGEKSMSPLRGYGLLVRGARSINMSRLGRSAQPDLNAKRIQRFDAEFGDEMKTMSRRCQLL
jgi:hypothetical protein